MKIVVCIKQVPDTTEIKLDPVTGTMIRDGVPSIMNPDDKGGLEMALALKDKYGAQVTVITMGPPQADDILREAFAMGADRAIHLSDRKFAGADTLATSNAIAGALRMLDFDLVITGRQAIDGDTAQVGPQIAEKLGLPQVTYVEEFEKAMDDDFNTYNINADDAACAIAEALNAEKLAFLTDIEGVYKDPKDPESLISELHVQEARDLITNGNVGGGMIPKLQGCIDAIENGVSRVHIMDGRIPHCLLLEIFTNKGIGTAILGENKEKFNHEDE